MHEKLIERFIRYCKIDTQSSESSTTYPSTSKQFDLANLLVEELKEIGLEEVEVDEHGYVMATLPARLPEGHPEVPTIGLIAHMDTSPAVTGANVQPQLITYEGGDIVLPKDNTQVIRAKDFPDLEKYIGTSLITTDGTTLLGADDKAGIAEIMTAIEELIADESAIHGAIRILFTPDEEIGKGTEYLDLKKFNVPFAYTVDGGPIGEIENENFNATNGSITIKGKNVHPGYAKNKMINSIRIAAFIIEQLPKNALPETTEGKEGYIHVMSVQGSEEETELYLIIRDFDKEALEEKKALVHSLCQKAERAFPGSQVTANLQESYSNMRFALDEHPEIVEYALEATKRAGLEPRLSSIRGGTDGALLAQKGIPTPNLFTGGYSFHSKTEWASVMAMEKSVEMLKNLCLIWAEKAKR